MKFVWYCGAALGLAMAAFSLALYVSSSDQSSDFYFGESSAVSNAVLIQDTDIDDVFVYLVFPFGEAANPYDEGLAHYVEHLAWLSTFARDEGKSLHSNAWTNQFSTGYWLRTEGETLVAALGNLTEITEPLSVPADFALEERNIVLREYDYRVAEDRYYPVLRQIDTHLYGDGALARSVIGEPIEIAEYSFETAKQLHEDSHVLSQATLLVYGNISTARFQSVLDTLESGAETNSDLIMPHGGWIAAATLQDRTFVLGQPGQEAAFIYRKVLPLRGCDGIEKCLLTAQIAQDALASALPGGLGGPLRFDAFIARYFSFEVSIIGTSHVEIAFIAHPDDEVSLEALEEAFQSAFRSTLQTGLLEDTFDRIHSRLAGQFSSVLERDRPGYNRDLALHALTSGQPIASLSDKESQMENIHLEDVNRFMNYLLTEGREVSRLVGREE